MEDAIPMEKAAQEESISLRDVFDNAPEVNTESGNIQVYLYQKTEAGNPIRFICGFIEFYEDELVVSAPKNSLLKDAEVMATVKLNYSGNEIKVRCKGILEEIDQDDENQDKDILTINVKDIDSKVYEQFMNLYAQRQESITDFMQKARGY